MDLSPEIVQFIKEELGCPYNTLGTYERYFIPKLQFHSALCTATIAAVNKILNPLIKRHSDRFFCRIDATHTIKSSASIIDKIIRSRLEAEKKKQKGESYQAWGLDNFVQEMADLARFRIVCNFLTDVYEVAECIRRIETIIKFFEEFDFKDGIRQHRRISGERSVKIILRQRNPPRLFLEIQIMTQLQEAWDKKDHYLVYEKRRSSSKSDEDNFPNYLDAKMSAMADLLYIADDYFDQLREETEEVHDK